MSTPHFDFPVNLDDMSTDPQELAEWAKALAVYDSAPHLHARRQLMTYAQTKARAMRARLAGQIATAEGYERQCDRLYCSLPQAYRW